MLGVSTLEELSTDQITRPGTSIFSQLLVGASDGATDGSSLGASDGDVDGVLDGASVGASVNLHVCAVCGDAHPSTQ